ncbi:MAG TPA: 3-isopropylmalate dehydratase small subunit [Holophagaceae bacterium]|nr:3-isopropylmalate dehydratase small subunit [Holophagaceae bacterium]
MKPFEPFESTLAVLPMDHVDTDQIIPARFLKTITREGLGEHCFEDWRRDPDFALNRPGARGATVLVAGENFGCGSSREHAPWALLDAGFRAVIARSFADIFKQNALKNALLPIEVDEATHRRLLEAPAGTVLRVDLDALHLPDGTSVPFTLDPFRRACLSKGVDEIGFVLEQESAIAAFEEGHAQGLDTRSGLSASRRPSRTLP